MAASGSSGYTDTVPPDRSRAHTALVATLLKIFNGSAESATALELAGEQQATVTTVRRVLVVGRSGSGKTTTARRIAGELGIPHIELDALHWGPDRTTATAGVVERQP